MKPILSRGFNCLIELWSTQDVADGFGGVTSNESLIGNIYARRIEQRGVNYDVSGATIDKYDQGFIIRKRDIDTTVNFVVYRDYKYTIISVESTQLETQIKLNCVNTNTLRNENIFDNTFDSTFQ
jgi:hypothetical protein